ncbi:hypothetical protein FSBG_01632 [Fusobacterium gonidiaformans 3-1-5R]|uniref:Uncharacterized protein n=1 Tax=Fusobacterium gonidiaformans 3-1-5R TaxID=469605 RepID=E5BI12_9FUSO|nr:hypothetical protein [Fusobacterium gonidiaformans]EFS22135.1 hypothetical protein FSBG_01632 [Fusobacterium gonidiaformans 3-1-5R]
MDIFEIIVAFIYIYFLYIFYDYYISRKILKKWQRLSKEKKEEFIKNLSKKNQKRLLYMIEIEKDREMEKQKKKFTKVKKKYRKER